MKKLAYLTSLVLCAAAPGGTLTDGDASMVLIGPPVFSATVGDLTLLTDAGASDQGFKYSWYYRTPNNNQNRILSSLDTPIESFEDNTAVIRYSDAGPLPPGFERFDADMTITLEDGANPGELLVCTEMVITNVNPGPVTYQFFNMVDLDLQSTPIDDTATVADSNAVLIRMDDGATNNYAELLGVGASTFQVDSSLLLRSLLNNGGAFNMNGDTTPYTGDVGVVLQWTLTIPGGGSETIVSKFAINQSLAASGCGPACDTAGGDGDVDDDCDVDLGDLAALLASFGASGVSHADGDTDFDGDVDLVDLANMLSVFGAICP